MDWSVIANLILGGGLAGAILGILTLRSSMAKARAEAEQARAEAERAIAEAESVRITNAENATRILVENIVKPLKEELNATREDLLATKREMASTKREMGRLRKAVEAAVRCPHSDTCPVLLKLPVDKGAVGEREPEGSEHNDNRGRKRCRADPAERVAEEPCEP